MSPQPNEKEKRPRPSAPTGTPEAAANARDNTPEVTEDDPLISEVRAHPEGGQYAPPGAEENQSPILHQVLRGRCHIFDLLAAVLHGEITMPEAKRAWREKWLQTFSPEERKKLLENRHEMARRMMQAAEALSQDLISYC